MKALENEEKEMELVGLVVHTEEDFEMKQEQVERAKKRWLHIIYQSSSLQQRLNLQVEAFKNCPQSNLCHVFGRPLSTNKRMNLAFFPGF